MIIYYSTIISTEKQSFLRHFGIGIIMNLGFKKLRIQLICVRIPCSVATDTEQHDNFVKNTTTTFSCLYIKQGYWVYRSGFELFSIL